MKKTLALLTLSLIVGSYSSQAQTSTNLFWDINGTTANVGGTGNWTTGGTTWSTSSAGTAATISGGWTNSAAWTNSNANNAIFQGTSGSVTLSSSSIYANQIQVNVSGYNFSNNSTSSGRYFRTKNGFLIGTGVNVNVSSAVSTNGSQTGFEGVITNAVGATGTSMTVTGATLNADSSVRIAFDGSNTDVWVPLIIATTGSGYASLKNVGGTNSIYGTVTVNSGSRLSFGAASSTRRINVRGNVTTANTDLVIGESGDAGFIVLYGTNSIGGNVLLQAGRLGYGSATAFGTSTVILSDATTFGQQADIGTTESDRTISNKLQLNGNVTFGNGSYASYIGGNVDLNGAVRTVTLANSTYLNGAITNGGISLSSSSATRTLYLNGNNTFASGTTQNGGVISLGSDTGLGTAGLTVNSNSVGNTLTATDGRVIANAISLATGASLNLDSGSTNAPATTWTQSGAISGAGSVTKTGVGTLLLTGNNSYSSGTAVANGSLVVVRPNVTATITSNSISLAFTNGTANGNYAVLPGALTGTYPAASFSGLGPTQMATFAASNGIATVQTKLAQAISFAAIATKSFGDAAFDPGASADSGLPVSYTSSNPYVATVSGNTVTIVGVGSTVITASQSGNSNYLPASDVSRTLTVQPVLSSVAGSTVSLNFQVSDLTAPLSYANGWSSNDPGFRPDGYASDTRNSNNVLGLLGGAYAAPANETTQLTYNFNSGSSDRFVFQWNQSISSSSALVPGEDVFGWKFLSGNSTAFSIRFLNDNSTGRNLLVQGYSGTGNELSLANGQDNDWYIDRNDANDFRVTADLVSKKWALDVFNKSNNTWFGLVANAQIANTISSLDGMAATWTVADNTFDATSGQYLGAGDNSMTFDNITIQGKQTVTIALNLPTNSVYNGSAQAIAPTTTPSGVALVVKYNGSTNAPINAGTYSVTAEVVDTNTYYSAPTSGSFTVAKVTPTIATAPTASAINAGQNLSASSLTGGSATGVGGTILAGNFGFSSPSTVPSAGTANQSVTFTPTDTANYNTVTASVSVTVIPATTPAEDYLSSFGLSGANAALSADPDNDGLTNAAEFAFGTSPVAATGTPVTVSDSGSNVTITFLGRTSGVNYVVKTTSDLSTGFSGTSAPAASSPQPSGLPAGYTQYKASVDTTSGDRKFLKVDATLQ